MSKNRVEQNTFQRAVLNRLMYLSTVHVNVLVSFMQEQKRDKMPLHTGRKAQWIKYLVGFFFTLNFVLYLVFIITNLFFFVWVWKTLKFKTFKFLITCYIDVFLYFHCVYYLHLTDSICFPYHLYLTAILNLNNLNNFPLYSIVKNHRKRPFSN